MAGIAARRSTISRTSSSSVAALYDVHGNPAALEAVLAEAGDAQLVFGGDMAAGPFPAEALDRMDLDAMDPRQCRSRAPGEIPEGGLISEWVVDQLEERHRAFIAGLPDTAQLDVEGIGRVLFCHGSHGDEEMILRTTPTSGSATC